jgi:hypothetical protein
MLWLNPLHAQFTYKIKADSVRLYNDNCNAELIIENSTRNINGFLFNYGNGRTKFVDISSLFQPLENQRLSTGNSPAFTNQALTGAQLRFVNGANDIVVDGSDPGTVRSHYIKFRSQTADKGVGLQTVPGGVNNNVPYEFDFATKPDGSAALMLLGDGPRQVHTIASLGASGTGWPIAFEVNPGIDPTDHQYDVIRLLTDRSIQFPQLGAGFLTTDATGRVSVVNDIGINPGGETLQSVTNRGATTTNPTLITAAANSTWALQVANNGSDNAQGLYVNIGASSTGTAFRVDKDGTPAFVVANNGSVGVGTSTPSRPFDVNGVIVGTDALLIRPNANGYAGTTLNQNGGTAWNISSRNASEGNAFQLLHLQNDGTTPDNRPFTVLPSGIIGINNNLAPDRTLQTIGVVSSVNDRALDAGSYTSNNFEARVSASGFSAGARPGYGFHAAGSFGTYLYANSEGDLHLKGSSGQDWNLWSSATLNLDNTMYYRGFINDGAPVNSATANGFYGVQRPGDSYSLLSFNAGGSVGPVQLEFEYGGNMMWRNKTDNNSWTGWRTFWTSANFDPNAKANTAGRYAGLDVGHADNSENISNEAAYMRFHWSGQGGQPTWLWGGNEPGNMYVYNPANFRVANANTVGDVDVSRIVYGDNATKTSEMPSGNPNSWMASGFYNAYTGTNVPYESWWALLNARHTNAGNNFGFQLLGNFYNSNDFFYRVQNGDNFSGWSKIWHSGNFDPNTKANTSGRYAGLDVGHADNAEYIGNDATYMRFHWNLVNGRLAVTQPSQPAYIWGANSASDSYLYNPANFSVNYANSAGTANNVSATNFLMNGYHQWAVFQNNLEGVAPPVNAGLLLGWNYSGGAGESYIVAAGTPNGGNLKHVLATWDGNTMSSNAQFFSDGTGWVRGTMEAISFYQTSDSTQKTDIQSLGYGLDAVLKLQTVSYKWKNQDNGNRHVGLLAQQVKNIVPEVVSGKEGEYRMAYAELVPVLINAIKEQQKEIELLEKKVNMLDAKIKKE